MTAHGTTIEEPGREAAGTASPADDRSGAAGTNAEDKSVLARLFKRFRPYVAAQRVPLALSLIHI